MHNFAISRGELKTAGANKQFLDRAAALVDEERVGAFVKRRPGACTGILWGCTTKGTQRGLVNCVLWVGMAGPIPGVYF